MKFEKLYRILHNQLKTNLGQSLCFSYENICVFSGVYEANSNWKYCYALRIHLKYTDTMYIGQILDTMKGEDSTNNLKIIVREMTLVLFGTVLLMLMRETSFDLLSIKVIKNMRQDLFKSFLDKDIEFYDQNKSGDLLSRLTGDIEKVQSSSTHDVALFIRRVLEVIGSLF